MSKHNPTANSWRTTDDEDDESWKAGVDEVTSAFIFTNHGQVLDMTRHLLGSLKSSDMKDLARMILDGLVKGDPSLFVENLLPRDERTSNKDYLMLTLQEWRRLTPRSNATVLIAALQKINPVVAQSFAAEFAPKTTSDVTEVKSGSGSTAAVEQTLMKAFKVESEAGGKCRKSLRLAVRCCAERALHLRQLEVFESVATVLKKCGMDLSHAPQSRSACKGLAKVLECYKSYIDSLRLQKCYIDNRGFRELKGVLGSFKMLTAMDLRYNDITATSFPAMAEIIRHCSATLQEFHFSSAEEPEEDEEPEIREVDATELIRQGLVHRTQLTQLTMHKCGITAANASDVSAILTACSNSLQEFDITLNDIGDEGMATLGQGLAQCTKLRKLWMAECGLTTGCTTVLHDGIASCTHLADIDLYDNRSLGDTCVVQLSSALQSLVGLQKLNLGRCGLTSACCAALRDCILAHHHSLTHLGLLWNAIDDDGLQCMSQSLRQSTSMVGFAMWWNDLTVSSLPVFTELLHHWPDLQVLWLDRQSESDTQSAVDVETQQEFITALAQCVQLKQLWVSRHWVCHGGAELPGLQRDGLEVGLLDD